VTRGPVGAGRSRRQRRASPYRFVRHPMYAGASVSLVFTPPALGSPWALRTALLLILVITFRAIKEEKFLAAELQGTSFCSACPPDPSAKRVRCHEVAASSQTLSDLLTPITRERTIEEDKAARIELVVVFGGEGGETAAAFDQELAGDASQRLARSEAQLERVARGLTHSNHARARKHDRCGPGSGPRAT
jgi:phospholipid methyltransferase